jgi:hypothetical protein
MVVEHAIYDVWVKACKMSFPGEEEAVDEKSSDAAPAPAAKKPSNAPPRRPPPSENTG